MPKRILKPEQIQIFKAGICPIMAAAVLPVVPTGGPDLKEWGPRLWRIFHALAERAGSGSILRQQVEEARIWSVFLGSLRKTIPCATCRQHYGEYLTGHGLEHALTKFGQERRIALRQWFYDFHAAVNARTGRTETPPADELPALYGSYTQGDFNADKTVLFEHMRRGMFSRMFTRDDYLKTQRSLEELWLISRG
jgi:hypothetical protein